jgi:hypothetical protein
MSLDRRWRLVVSPVTTRFWTHQKLNVRLKLADVYAGPGIPDATQAHPLAPSAGTSPKDTSAVFRHRRGDTRCRQTRHGPAGNLPDIREPALTMMLIRKKAPMPPDLARFHLRRFRNGGVQR